MEDLKDAQRSLVRIDFRGYVHKTFRGEVAHERYDNEVAILHELERRGCQYVPKIIEEHPEELRMVTTNCGSSAPRLSEQKAEDLFQQLENDYGIRHGDEGIRNVTYCDRLGRFCLIDFELAEALPHPSAINEETNHLHSHYRTRWVAASVPGKGHEINDDSWLAVATDHQFVEKLPSYGERFLNPDHLIFAVSDGMGGHGAGDFASRFVMADLLKKLPKYINHPEYSPEGTQELTELFKQVHHGLQHIADQNPAVNDMGATLTVAWLTDTRILIGNVGDSRLYRFRNEQLEQLSLDHTEPGYALKSGAITEKEFRSHPDRHLLLEAVGGSAFPSISTTKEYHFEPGDRYLLCSDGLIDGLWDHEIESFLKKRESLAFIATELLESAREKSDEDDTTLILFEISSKEHD